METSDSEVGLQQVKVVWRFATIMPGAQCVMTSGELLMLMWPVDSWDSLAIVRNTANQLQCLNLQFPPKIVCSKQYTFVHNIFFLLSKI